MATPASEVRIQGLLAGARVEVVATLASALPKAQQVTVWAALWAGPAEAAEAVALIDPDRAPMRGRLPIRLALLVAAGLRFTGLGFGLRHHPRRDERVFVEAVEQMRLKGRPRHGRGGQWTRCKRPDNQGTA